MFIFSKECLFFFKYYVYLLLIDTTISKLLLKLVYTHTEVGSV